MTGQGHLLVGPGEDGAGLVAGTLNGVGQYERGLLHGPEGGDQGDGGLHGLTVLLPVHVVHLDHLLVELHLGGALQVAPGALLFEVGAYGPDGPEGGVEAQGDVHTSGLAVKVTIDADLIISSVPEDSLGVDKVLLEQVAELQGRPLEAVEWSVEDDCAGHLGLKLDVGLGGHLLVVVGGAGLRLESVGGHLVTEGHGHLLRIGDDALELHVADGAGVVLEVHVEGGNTLAVVLGVQGGEHSAVVSAMAHVKADLTDLLKGSSQTQLDGHGLLGVAAVQLKLAHDALQLGVDGAWGVLGVG